METQIISYMLKANTALLLFYLLYLAAFKNDTFIKARRYYFLFVIFFSLVFPVILIDGLSSIFSFTAAQSPVTAELFIGETTAEVLQEQTPKKQINWYNIFATLYIIGVVALLARLMMQLISIYRIYRKSQAEIIDNCKILNVEDLINPFTFFRNIFINTKMHTHEELKQILLHEQTHACQLHTIDTLLGELLNIIFWWNPISWIIKKEMRNNLEYLADYAVINQGVPEKTYQYHLLRMTEHDTAIQIASNFNISQLKNRIMMMNKSKTPERKLAKYLLILPLAITLIVVNSCMSNVSEPMSNDDETTLIEEPQSDDPIAEAPKDDSEVFAVVEEQPQFPGGNVAMMKFLADNIKYPVEAQEKGLEGRVIANFVVEKDGSITDLKIVRGIDPLLDNEALRIIKMMPDWEPGKQKGEKVRVRFTLPTVFKLMEKDKSKATQKNENRLTENSDPTNEVFVVVEEQPLFPGGSEAMMNFLKEKINYPKEAQDKGIHGRVVVNFVVEKDGSITDLKIARGIDPLLDNEALRVIKSMPDWEPGKQKGEKVRVRFTLPVIFNLSK